MLAGSGWKPEQVQQWADLVGRRLAAEQVSPAPREVIEVGRSALQMVYRLSLAEADRWVRQTRRRLVRTGGL